MITRTAADRIAALAAYAAQAPVGIVGTVDGGVLRIIGGFGLDWSGSERAALEGTLTTSVIDTGEPRVVTDTTTDPRIAAESGWHRPPIRAYAAFPVLDGDKQVVGICCVLDEQPREWTERELAAVDDSAQTCALLVEEQRARQEIDRQRRFLDAVLDTLHDGVWACDAQGRLVLSNARMLTIRGGQRSADVYDPEMLVGMWHADGTPVTRDSSAMIRALRGETMRGEDLIIESPGRRRRRYQLAGGPISGPDGEPLGAVVALQDVTRRKRAERFRLCELAVVRALTETATIEEAGPRVLEAVVTTLGWAHAELWLVDPDATVLRPAGRWSKESPAAEITIPAELPYGQGLGGRAWHAGKPLWIRDIGNPQSLISEETATRSQLHTALAVPVTDTSGTVAVLNVFADVVEDPEDELVALLGGIAAHIGQFLGQRMVADLQRQLARSKDEYLSLVGHELRTPLTSISTYTELLREVDERALLEHGPAMIEVIDRNTAQLRQIIDELLELSALDTGHAPLQAVPCDLAAVVRDAVAAAGSPTSASGSPLTVDAQLPAELVIPGDAHRLRQVVDNLLGNAVKYSPDGGRITVRLHSTQTTAILTVSDTGMGIAPAEREKMFGRLYRATEVREKAIPGSGLGLALSRAVVERHHGTIALEPHDGPGTTVALRLPVHAR